MSKILLVTGSRSIHDITFVSKCLNEIKKIYDFDKIIQGGASGVDTAARFYAKANNIENKTYIPAWKKFGKAAGIIRNSYMVKACDKGVAIWDGKSRGTKDTIDKLTKANKLLKVFAH